MSTPQQYCLRWNNHRSNLLTVFDQLLQNEAFTDVTLACEGGTSVKCHKMVLAACSSYFQCLFTELPCQHPVVVLKDVGYGEMKAILEYMYRGEVNVAQDQLAALLKVAEALKVKGLVEENTASRKSEEEVNAISTSTGPAPPSGSGAESALPHSTGGAQAGFSRYPGYGYSKSSERSVPMWAVPGMPVPAGGSNTAQTAAAVLNRCYEAVTADMPPLRRKKLSSLLMSRDTPILRTVLGQGQNIKPDPASEDAPSPYTDVSTAEDEYKSGKLVMQSSSPQSLYNESKG
ncbi:hypothetical protein AAG570_008296 [Ranatra chinensis]|uniref:BTB domain-containing protein n=1 Tax=Ranatra chinensis TaxID=642074 RepID=A0ABD0YEI4_9HEMI